MSIHRLAGLRYAAAHQSVNKGASPKTVYSAIKSAIQNDPFRTEVKTDAKRWEALQLAFERISRLGDRYNENYRIAPADRKRIEHEFSYLKSKVQTIASGRLYSDFLRVSDPEEPSEVHAKRFETYASYLNQLMDATFSGAYKQNPENVTDVLTGLRKVALGRFEGDFNEAFGLEFDGKKGWFKRNLIIPKTTLDLKEDFAGLREGLKDKENEEAFLKEAAILTRKAIIENPLRAVATQVDGIEKTGKINIDIHG